MKQFILLYLLCLPAYLFGQTVSETQLTVRGRVVNTHNETLPGAHVWFIHPNDTLQKQGAATDADGKFTIQLPAGRYEMQVSYIGYAPYTAEVQATQSMTLPDIYLNESGKMMEEVKVTARRITYNVQGYKANIQSYPLLKTQTLENVLRFLPGLSVRPEGLLSYGENVLAVYVNNRKVRFHGKDLISYLSTFDAKAILSVEVLDSTAEPGATAGMGSVIKITTIHIEDGGMASFGLSGSDGSVNDFSISPYLNAQQKAGKWSAYAVASIDPHSKRTIERASETDYYANESQRLESQSNTFKSQPSMSYTLGVGYDFNKASSLLLDGGVQYRKQFASSETQNELFQGGNLDNQSKGTTWQKNKRQGYNLSLEYNYTLSNITFQATASYAQNKDDEENSREQTASEAPNYTMNRLWDNKDYRIWTMQTGVRWNINTRHRLSQFIDYSNWDNTSHTDAQASVDGQQDPYNTYLSNYLYKESSFSTNTSYGYAWKNLDVSLGFRVKHTRINPLLQTSEEVSYQRDYTDFLPYASINYLINQEKGHKLSFQYARIISYPGMTDLNPAIRWNSEYSYSTGNPNLKPMLDNVFILQSTFFGYTLHSSYKTQQTYLTVPHVEENSNIIVNSPESGGKNRTLGFSLSAPFTPCNGWMLSVSGSYVWSEYQYQSQKVISNGWGAELSSMNSLPWDMSLMVNVLFSSPAKDVFTESQFPCMVMANLSRPFLNNRLNASLGFNYMGKMDSKTRTESYYSHSKDSKADLKVTLSLRYMLRWGNNKRVRVKQGSGNEELKRLGN